ncbi:hypothetical protein [Nocardia australiensis]|uniref:hypothetical protein n=1 Tax=Nocardia australiensis TaxID=2887191 RepID=UPI001D146DF8|nr:hypothetical protein [Nocardia australiensis]
MTEMPWNQSPSPEQREIDKITAANMGISLEELYDIDRKVAEDVRARDAIPRENRVVDGNPKFNKGFGPNTPANNIQPGELRAYYDSMPSNPGNDGDEHKR